MKPKYFKYWWGAKLFDIYRIRPDGTIEVNEIMNADERKRKWRIVPHGHFAKLHESSIEEISEEDYFLSML